MLTYCLKSKNDTERVDSKRLTTKNGIPMLSSKCAACCHKKKSRLTKKQEAKGWLSSLRLKTPLSKVPLLGDILF